MSQFPSPPAATKRETVRDLHGDTVHDPYAWLRNKSDPDVIEHLEAENVYTAAVLAPTENLQAEIFDEIKNRTLETDLSVPAKRGDWWYNTRSEEGKAYTIWVRRLGRPDGEEHIVIDENVEAESEDYFRLGNLAVSADQRFVAYSTDTTGAESYTTTIRDLESGETLEDIIEGCRYGLAWSRDGQFLFYTMADKTLRPFQVWRHEVGSQQSSDELVIQEDDDRFYLDISRTRSGDYIIVEAGSAITQSAWSIPTRDPLAEPREIMPRVEGVEYSVDHRGDVFWAVTNDTDPDGRLVGVPVDGGSPYEVVPSEEGRKLTAPTCFADHVLVWGRERGLPAVFRLDDAELSSIDFDEPVYQIGPDANHEFESDMLRYSYQSFVTPHSIMEINLETDERTLLKTTPILGGFNGSDYVQERLWATASDGAKIPISLVRSADVPVDGTAPLLLYAYGSYEVAIPARFSIPRLSLLDRGVVFAIAHVRGGGEMGKQWYTDGKFAHKHNTFSDLVDSANFLADAMHCDRERIAIRGASAGGLTVGAALNLAPESFAAVVGEVPFVDVVNTMLDASLPLTVVEWEEWGNPAREAEYAWMRAYAPYENIVEANYPPILATAGLNDPRVSYWEPAKWVQKLRDHSTSDNAVLLKTEMSSGHFARSGRYDTWRDEATVLAFVLSTLDA